MFTLLESCLNEKPVWKIVCVLWLMPCSRFWKVTGTRNLFGKLFVCYGPCFETLFFNELWMAVQHGLKTLLLLNFVFLQECRSVIPEEQGRDDGAPSVGIISLAVL